MNQKIIKDSIRFSPLALAVALSVVLGLLALQARAQEPESENAEAELEESQTKSLFGERNIERFMETSQDAQSNEDGEEKRMLLDEGKQTQTEMMRALQEDRLTAFEKKKNELKERIETRKEERLVKQEEHKERLSAQAQMRLSSYAERIVTRMTTVIERMYSVTERTASRIQKMEEAGIDVTEMRIQHGEVYKLIEKSREYVALISEVTIDTLTSENPEDQKGEIRESVTLAKESIREIHIALMETVREMQRAVSLREERDVVQAEED